MAEKILSLKVLTPIKSLEIHVENDRDIDLTEPLTYGRFKAIGRSCIRTGIAMTTNVLFFYSVGQVGSCIREYFM